MPFEVYAGKKARSPEERELAVVRYYQRETDFEVLAPTEEDPTDNATRTLFGIPQPGSPEARLLGRGSSRTIDVVTRRRDWLELIEVKGNNIPKALAQLENVVAYAVRRKKGYNIRAIIVRDGLDITKHILGPEELGLGLQAFRMPLTKPLAHPWLKYSYRLSRQIEPKRAGDPVRASQPIKMPKAGVVYLLPDPR